jgi:LacI family transcriptional regulator
MTDRDGRNSSGRGEHPVNGTPVTASISSIAKDLGVSVSTVSAVINGRGYASPKMRERIEKHLRKVDYQPNYLARSLRKRETRIIGLIVPDLVNSFYSYLSRGVEDFLKSEDYLFIVADSRENWKRQRDYIQTFCRMMTDGILLVPCLATSAQIESIPSLVRDRPLVYLDRSPLRPPVDSVMIDNERASFEATDHLIGMGHSRIAIITEPLNLLSAADRLKGYRCALKTRGIKVDPSLVCAGSNTKESAYDIGLRLLTGKRMPTAVVICNNQMTLGFLAALRDRNIACPEQLSVVGFDDCDWSEHIQPALTVIVQPALEMGTTAARILLDRITDKTPRPCKTTLLGFHLISRKSTAPPRYKAVHRDKSGETHS